MAADKTDAVTLEPCVSLSLHFRLVVPDEAAADLSVLYEACRTGSTGQGIDELDARSLFGADPAQGMLAVTGAVDAAAIERSRDDMVILHSSLVVSPSGPVLLVGPSGAGKSSLSAAMTATGWTYAGDEAIGLDLTGEGLFANPKPWKLDGAARTALETLGVAATPGADAAIETLVAPCAVGRSAPPGPLAAPVAVVRLEFCSGAEADAEPLRRPDVAELLATQCFNFGHLGAVALDAVAHVARTVPGMHLRFGRLADAADTLRERVA